jgi:hypothetical protein
VSLPERSNAVNHGLNDFWDTGAVYTERRTTTRELGDVSAVGQINRNDLLHLEVLCSHESSQTNTSHSEDDNTLVRFRFQDVEYCPCASLEPAAAGRKDPHLLCLPRKLDHTGLTYDAQTREAALAKELALQRLAVGFALRGRGAVAAGTHQIEHALIAVTRMSTGTSFAGPTKAVR